MAFWSEWALPCPCATFHQSPQGAFHLLSFLLHLCTPQSQFPWVGSAGVKEGGDENSRCPRVGDTSDLGSCLQRSCSNCGNSFCSRCCSFKVPRSSMGATGEWCRWWQGLVGIPSRGCHIVARGARESEVKGTWDCSQVYGNISSIPFSKILKHLVHAEE